jgi:hypothetical protein
VGWGFELIFVPLLVYCKKGRYKRSDSKKEREGYFAGGGSVKRTVLR